MFVLTKPQKDIQKAAREFVKGEFDKDVTSELEKEMTCPDELVKKAGELGFIGIHFDEKFEGGGMGQLENALIAEAFCTRDATMGKALTMTGFACECLLRYGSMELKEKLLPQVTAGTLRSGGCFTEPGRGGDLSVLTTTSVKEGDFWIIHGKKSNVINGGAAGFYIVLCRDGDNPDDQGKQNLFLVEAGAKGIETQPVGKKIGNNLIPMAHVGFDAVKVPASCLLGKQGKGGRQVQQFFMESHLLSAAQAVGIAQGAFERALGHVKQRVQFKQKLAAFQITRHKIADMATHIETARLFTYSAALAFDKKDRRREELAAMAKLTACGTALAVADEAIQLFGGYGYMQESEVERFYRDAKATDLFENAAGFQKDMIADKVIGKM